MEGVSVIVPAHNAEATLIRTVESILRNGSVLHEVIIVDDGSDDRTGELAFELAKSDQRIRTIVHESNQGLSSARNTGLREASGKTVCFWDADDLMHPYALRRLLKVLNSTGADMVRGILVRRSGAQRWISRRSSVLRNAPSIGTLQSWPQYTADISACSGIFSTAFLRSNNLSFTRGLYMQDIPFCIEAFAKARSIAVLFHPMGDYLARENSASRKINTPRFNALSKVQDLLEQTIKSHQLEHLCATGIRSAFINSAITAFVRPALENRNETGGWLEQLSEIVRRCGEQSVAAYALDMSDIPTLLELTAIRHGKFDLAAAVRSNTNSGWQQLSTEMIADPRERSRVLGLIAEIEANQARGSGGRRKNLATADTFWHRIEDRLGIY